MLRFAWLESKLEIGRGGVQDAVEPGRAFRRRPAQVVVGQQADDVHPHQRDHGRAQADPHIQLQLRAEHAGPFDH